MVEGDSRLWRDWLEHGLTGVQGQTVFHLTPFLLYLLNLLNALSEPSLARVFAFLSRHLQGGIRWSS